MLSTIQKNSPRRKRNKLNAVNFSTEYYSFPNAHQFEFDFFNIYGFWIFAIMNKRRKKKTTNNLMCLELKATYTHIYNTTNMPDRKYIQITFIQMKYFSHKICCCCCCLLFFSQFAWIRVLFYELFLGMLSTHWQEIIL